MALFNHGSSEPFAIATYCHAVQAVDAVEVEQLEELTEEEEEMVEVDSADSADSGDSADSADSSDEEDPSGSGTWELRWSGLEAGRKASRLSRGESC